jgi:outer membrane protein assembly factor BamB
VSDFVAGLRDDLMEAAREQARGQAGRTRDRSRRPALPALPALRPVVVLGAIALAAVAVALAVLLASVAPQDIPQSASPKVVKRVVVDGQPHDAVFAAGSLWITTAAGRVLRVDPATGDVASVAALRGDGVAMAAGNGRLWALGHFLRPANAGREEVLRIDPASGKVLVRRSAVSGGSAVAIGATGLWISSLGCPCGRSSRLQTLVRRDATTGRVTGEIRLPNGWADLAASGGTVWHLAQDGALTAVDEAALTVVRRVPGLAALGADGDRMLAADPDGVWVADAAADHMIRVTTQGITRRLPIAPNPGPFAVAGRRLWVVTGDRLGGAKQLLNRVDARTGEVTGTVDLGAVVVRAVVAVAGGVWVVEESGRLVRVRG